MARDRDGPDDDGDLDEPEYRVGGNRGGRRGWLRRLAIYDFANGDEWDGGVAALAAGEYGERVGTGFAEPLIALADNDDVSLSHGGRFAVWPADGSSNRAGRSECRWVPDCGPAHRGHAGL